MDQPHSLFRDLQLVRVCGVEMCVVWRWYGEGVWCGDVCGKGVWCGEHVVRVYGVETCGKGVCCGVGGDVCGEGVWVEMCMVRVCGVESMW